MNYFVFLFIYLSLVLLILQLNNIFYHYLSFKFSILKLCSLYRPSFILDNKSFSLFLSTLLINIFSKLFSKLFYIKIIINVINIVK